MRDRVEVRWNFPLRERGLSGRRSLGAASVALAVLCACTASPNTVASRPSAIASTANICAAIPSTEALPRFFGETLFPVDQPVQNEPRRLSSPSPFGVVAVCQDDFRIGPAPPSMRHVEQLHVLYVGTILFVNESQARSWWAKWSRPGHLYVPLVGAAAGSVDSAFAIPSSLERGVGIDARVPNAEKKLGIGPSINVGWLVRNLLLFVHVAATIPAGKYPRANAYLFTERNRAAVVAIAKWMNTHAQSLT